MSSAQFEEIQGRIRAARLPLVHQTELIQDVQRIEAEVESRAPRAEVITAAMKRIAGIYSEVLSSLLTAMPDLAQYVEM